MPEVEEIKIFPPLPELKFPSECELRKPVVILPEAEEIKIFPPLPAAEFPVEREYASRADTKISPLVVEMEILPPLPELIAGRVEIENEDKIPVDILPLVEFI